MRVSNSLALLGLLGAATAAPAPQAETPTTTTLAIPTEVPSDPSVALDQLEALASATAELVQADVAEGNGTSTSERRALSLFGSCTPAKLRIRREW